LELARKIYECNDTALSLLKEQPTNTNAYTSAQSSMGVVDDPDPDPKYDVDIATYT
jgi:hypothetical protein